MKTPAAKERVKGGCKDENRWIKIWAHAVRARERQAAKIQLCIQGSQRAAGEFQLLESFHPPERMRRVWQEPLELSFLQMRHVRAGEYSKP